MLTAMIIVAVSLPMYGVTTQEMEQAKATTALWYLRYANNGSGYLEEIKPATLDQLEKSLKAKEKENLKAFKAVKTPSDYSAWDKDKLVEYWSVTFFKSPGLDENGVIARSRVKKKLSEMKVSAPAPEAAAPTATAEMPAPELPSSTPEGDDVANQNPVLPSGEQVMEDAVQLEDSLAATSDAAPKSKSEEKKESNSTWIYVIVLILLVGVVIWLVIFASKTMQQRPKEDEDEAAENDVTGAKRGLNRKKEAAVMPVIEEEETVVVAPRIKSESDLREKYARSLANKEEEIAGLHREIHGLREECLRLGEENGRLNSDLTSARREVEALRGRLKAASAVTSASVASGRTAQTASERIEREVSEADNRQVQRKTAEPNEIYLGRVNNKGLFVRADRQPVDGKSMYVLMTQDGYTGTYRVLQRTSAIEMGLENPQHYLAGGCVAADIEDTEDATSIRTLSAGTAIFEDGCWRVLRKAKIEYED